MATDSFINSELFLQRIREQINGEMLAAAEPLIKEAMEKIERQMRTTLAARLIGSIEQSTHFYERENHLVIHIDREKQHG